MQFLRTTLKFSLSFLNSYQYPNAVSKVLQTLQNMKALSSASKFNKGALNFGSSGARNSETNYTGSCFSSVSVWSVYWKGMARQGKGALVSTTKYGHMALVLDTYKYVFCVFAPYSLKPKFLHWWKVNVLHQILSFRLYSDMWWLNVTLMFDLSHKPYTAW